MEVANYCVIAGVSILLLLGCLLHLIENDTFSAKTIGRFQRLIYVLIIEIVIDCVFAALEGHEIPSTILYIMKGIELILNPISAFLVFDIFYNKKVSRGDKNMNRIRKMMVLVININALLQLLAIAGYHVFIIDNNNMYRRGPLMPIYVALLLFMIVTLAIGIVVYSTKTQSIMKATLFSFTMLLVTSVALRFFFPKKNYDFLCIAISTLFLLIYYSHVTLRIDPLTKMLNRHVYARLIERIDYTTIIIIIDVNHFKQINDTYGHACGDQVLKNFASIICKAYGQYAYCFRTGGDEFCIILKPNVFEKLLEETPNCDVYSMAEGLMEKLETLIGEYNMEKGEYSLLENGVSQGYGIFYSHPSEATIDYNDMPLKEVLELADQRMYRNKEKYRIEHPGEIEPNENHKRIGVLYKPSRPILVEEEDT